MTLLQTSLGFKVALALGLLCAAIPSTNAGEIDRQPLFVCGTDRMEDKGFLDLAGVETDFAVWTDLQFTRTADGTGELVYAFPRDAADPRTSFFFSHSDGDGGYLVSIRWVDEGANYVYYSLAIPPDPADEDDMGGGEAGLVISRDGKLIERAACAERPYMFIDYLRNAMSCDETNPYGPAACAESSFERTAPLDIDKMTIR